MRKLPRSWSRLAGSRSCESSYIAQSSHKRISAFPKLAVLVDTETTGLHHTQTIIKIGAIAFTYGNEGMIEDDSAYPDVNAESYIF